MILSTQFKTICMILSIKLLMFLSRTLIVFLSNILISFLSKKLISLLPKNLMIFLSQMCIVFLSSKVIGDFLVQQGDYLPVQRVVCFPVVLSRRLFIFL